MENRAFKVVVPLYKVPEREMVSKITGEKRYCVRDAIEIFTEGGDRSKNRSVTPKKGFRLLVGRDGGISEVPEMREVLWLLKDALNLEEVP